MEFTNYYVKPSIEKYINEDVHAELKGYDQAFTYDIIVYVTKDAVKTTITDTLVDGLKFKSTAANVKVLDLGDFAPAYEPDHTAKGTVSKRSGTVVETAAVAIAGKTLTVTLADSTKQRGHWLQVTFDAIFDPDVINEKHYTAYKERAVDIGDNGIVISKTYPTHVGVPNTVEYTIEGKNNFKCVSNTVTVTPPKPEVPKMGDISNGRLYRMLLALSIAMLAGAGGILLFYKKREKEDEK